MHVPLVTSPAQETYQLLELPPELEAHIEAGPATLHFLGRLSDEAVLVTQDATYAVRQVLQSNSRLLCSVETALDGDVQLHLRENVRETLEVVRTSALLDRLATLLQDDMYMGPADEVEQRHYTPAEVKSIVQASEAELLEGRRTYHILELDGFWRRVAPDVVLDLLRSLLAHLDIFACSPDRVPFARMCDALAPRACRAVAQAVVGDWFCASVPRSLDAPPAYVSLARASIVQFMGRHVLQTHKRMPLRAFLDAWHQQVGQALQADVQLTLLQVRPVHSPPGTLSPIPTPRHHDRIEPAHPPAAHARGARARRYHDHPVFFSYVATDSPRPALPRALSDAPAVDTRRARALHCAARDEPQWYREPLAQARPESARALELDACTGALARPAHAIRLIRPRAVHAVPGTRQVCVTSSRRLPIMTPT